MSFTHCDTCGTPWTQHTTACATKGLTRPAELTLDTEIDGLLDVERYDPDGMVLRTVGAGEEPEGLVLTHVGVRGMRVDQLSDNLWKVYYL